MQDPPGNGSSETPATHAALPTRSDARVLVAFPYPVSTL